MAARVSRHAGLIFGLESRDSTGFQFQRAGVINLGSRKKRGTRFLLPEVRQEAVGEPSPGRRERPLSFLRYGDRRPRSHRHCANGCRRHGGAGGAAIFRRPRETTCSAPEQGSHHCRLDGGSPAPGSAGNREDIIHHHDVYFGHLRLLARIMVFERLGEEITGS